MSEPTRTIWLNYGCDCPEWPNCLCVKICDEDITWSVDAAVDHALEFVPMSDYATLRQEVERLKGELNGEMSAGQIRLEAMREAEGRLAEAVKQETLNEVVRFLEEAAHDGKNTWQEKTDKVKAILGLASLTVEPTTEQSSPGVEPVSDESEEAPEGEE